MKNFILFGIVKTYVFSYFPELEALQVGGNCILRTLLKKKKYTELRKLKNNTLQTYQDIGDYNVGPKQPFRRQTIQQNIY